MTPQPCQCPPECWESGDHLTGCYYRGLLNFLMGQIMKATKGKANPELAKRLLLERLNKE